MSEPRGRVLFKLGSVYDQRLSPGGSHVAAHLGRKLVVRECERGRKIATMPSDYDDSHQFGVPMAFNANASRLADVTRAGVLRVWDLPSGKLLHSMDVASRYSLAWDGLGRFLVMGGSRMGVWDSLHRTLVDDFPDAPGDPVVAADPQGITFAAVEEHLLVWNLESKRIAARVPLPTACDSLAYAPQGDVVIANCDEELVVCALRTAPVVSRVKVRGFCTYACDISPDGSFFARCGEGGTQIWDLRSGERVREWAPPAWDVKFGASRPLIVVTEAGEVRELDA